MTSTKKDSPTVLPSDSLVPLESVLCTEELQRRPRRPPDYKTENRALVSLAQALAESPRTILQVLADTILEIFEADSAGLSLLTKDDGGKRFYWPAIAGQWKPHIGGGTPRDFGPCGDVLDRNAPLLFRHFERRYTYFLPVTPPVEECLLVPFYVEGKAVGTIWAIAHDRRRKFDGEDLRQLESLGRFASAAYQAVALLDASEQQDETLRQNCTELAQNVAELRKANVQAQDSRRAALNLMEDAVRSRQLLETLNVELRESEERYRTLFASAPMAVFVCDHNAVIQHYNERAVELWGREPACGVERHCGSVKLWLPDGTLLKHSQSPISEVLRTGVSTLNAEVFIERPDGSRLPVLVNFAALKDARGEVTGAITSFIDITDRKRAEERLKESEARFRAIFTQATVGIAQTDLSGAFTLVNERYCEIVGRTAEQLIGMNMLDITHPEDAKDNADLFKRIVEGRGNLVLEERYIRPDRTPVWVRNSVCCILDADCHPQCVMAVVHDITERKRAEDLLRAAHDRMTQILESINEGFVTFDQEMRCTYINPVGEKLFRRRGEELVGKKFEAVCPEVSSTPFYSAALKLLSEGLPVELTEYYAPLGCWFEVHMHRTPEGIVAYFSDVTDRRRAAEEKEELLSILTHDLKNHLGGMNMSAQILRDRAAAVQDGAVQLMAENLSHSSSQMLAFLKQFLANSSADHRLVTRFESVNLGDVAARVVQQYRAVGERKGIIFETSIPADETFVRTDATALNQVLENLVSNAVKFSQGGTQIRISIESSGTHIDCRVQDQGPGFTEYDKTRMFRRYQRLSARPTGGEPSTGLGLSIVKKLMDAIQAELRYEDTPGGGTTFILRFPRAEGPH